MEKEKGGLGVGSLDKLNKALLAKWYWRFRKEDRALWVQIIKSIHGHDSVMGNGDSIKTGSTWKRIVKVLQELKTDNIDPRGKIKAEVGNGRNTSFWEDWWLGDKRLKDEFQRAYTLDPNRNATVEERCKERGRNWIWYREIRQGRSKDEVERLLQITSEVTLTDKEDRWLCKGGPKDKFTVAWMKAEAGKSNHAINGKNRWSNWVPKRVNILIWRILKNRIPVKATLMEMGIPNISPSCDRCNDEVESVFHVFWECRIARAIWAEVRKWWSLSDWSPTNMEEVVDGLEAQGRDIKVQRALRLIGFAVLYTLWLNRNEGIFHNNPISVETSFVRIQKDSLLWIDSRASKICVDRSIWLSNPSIAISPL